MSRDEARTRREPIEQVGRIIDEIRSLLVESGKNAAKGGQNSFRKLGQYLKELKALVESNRSEMLTDLDSDAPERFSRSVCQIPQQFIPDVGEAIQSACDQIESWVPPPPTIYRKPKLVLGTDDEVVAAWQAETEGLGSSSDDGTNQVLSSIIDTLRRLDEIRQYLRNQTSDSIDEIDELDDSNWIRSRVGIEFCEDRLLVRSISTNEEIQLQSRLDFNALRFIASRGGSWTSRDQLRDHWHGFGGHGDGAIDSCLTRLRRRTETLRIRIAISRGVGWRIEPIQDSD